MATNRRVWKNEATTPKHAWDQFRAWAASPSNRMTGDFMDLLSRFVRRPHVAGGVVRDSRIAAICVSHGIEVLLTWDRDFSLSPELRTRDPFRHGL